MNYMYLQYVIMSAQEDRDKSWTEDKVQLNWEKIKKNTWMTFRDETNFYCHIFGIGAETMIWFDHQIKTKNGDTADHFLAYPSIGVNLLILLYVHFPQRKCKVPLNFWDRNSFSVRKLNTRVCVIQNLLSWVLGSSLDPNSCDFKILKEDVSHPKLDFLLPQKK